MLITVLYFKEPKYVCNGLNSVTVLSCVLLSEWDDWWKRECLSL